MKPTKINKEKINKFMDEIRPISRINPEDEIELRSELIKLRVSTLDLLKKVFL